MKDLKTIINDNLKETKGELIYSEQLYVMLEELGFDIPSIYDFIKSHMKNKESHLLKLKEMLIQKGYTKDDINFFIAKIDKRNISNKCHIDFMSSVCNTNN